MHKRFVLNIVGRNLIFASLFMAAPLAWALHDNPHSRETGAFFEAMALGLTAGLTLMFFFRIGQVDLSRFTAKDALAIVGLSWLTLSIFGALPLHWAGVTEHFTDAFFEIVSGFTTTGATIFPNVEILPRGVLFWRSLTHWLGGMGIVVLYLALIPAVSQTAFQLFKAEAPGITVERIEPRIKETAKSLWLVYVVLSAGECLLLYFGGMTVFDALCHTFGTMATGGFSTKNASLAAYTPYLQSVVIVFMFLAGTNFMLHYQFLRGGFKAYLRSEEFRVYALTIFGASMFFSAVLLMAGHGASIFRDVLFQVVSIITTTGYVTADFGQWPDTLKFFLVMLMFMGGCGGSTGGGMKVVRVCLSVKVALRSIIQAVFPNSVVPIKFNKTALPDRLVSSVLIFFVIYLLLFFVGTFLFLLLEQCDIETGFSAVVATLSNIGPGLGRVGAVENYQWINLPGKWLLIFLMLAGRLELYAILVLFLPATWRK